MDGKNPSTPSKYHKNTTRMKKKHPNFTSSNQNLGKMGEYHHGEEASDLLKRRRKSDHSGLLGRSDDTGGDFPPLSAHACAGDDAPAKRPPVFARIHPPYDLGEELRQHTRPSILFLVLILGRIQCGQSPCRRLRLPEQIVPVIGLSASRSLSLDKEFAGEGGALSS